MNPYTELITRYINGELSVADQAAFEAQLNSNAELKKEYELQLKLVEGVKRMGLKNQLSSSFKKVKTNKLITKAAIGGALTLAVLGAVLLVKHQSNKAPDEIRYELNEEGKANWSEADKNLESQVFRINPDRDTIIETQQGIVIAIPAASFEHTTGEGVTGSFDLEIKEAMTAADIMKAGLSTMSNDKLLETGGMFYINARQGNNNLAVNRSKPLNVNVPVNNNKNDMMLFKGERRADGSINWVEPKPMKRKLTTVDILKLDFYPEHFLDSLKAMGFNSKNKKLTDSIYYSLGGCGGYTSSEEGHYSFDAVVGNAKVDTTASRNTVKPDGEKLFRQNCSVCHFADNNHKLTGPGLKGVLDRVPSMSWMKKWILNSDKVTASGDAYAKKIKEENGNAAMTVFEGQLSDADVSALMKYITGKSDIVIDESPVMECREIDPSRIKAIWDKQFNRTILATKAFEERLKVIFQTCDARVLQLYVNNLDHDLYELDSTAATLTSGELQTAFKKFAERRDGGVEISNDQGIKLQKYFEEKQAFYYKTAFDIMQKRINIETKLNEKALEKQNSQSFATLFRNFNNYQEELEINMDEAYRQVGKKRTPVSDNYASGTISQTGWNNLDRYVIESTFNRTTLDYTDPENGKKAVIKYEPVSVTVTNSEDYDRIVCYMIPDKLSSFQLMKQEGTVFKEKLNELLKYSIMTLGFKGNKTFYYEIKNAKAQDYSISLTAIKAAALDKKLNTAFPLNQKKDLLKDIAYQQFDVGEIKRQKKIRQREEIRSRLTRVVFPCTSSLTPVQQAVMIQRAEFQADSISQALSNMLNY
jgi:mono/diheme cytochrome c family protein